MIDRHGPDDTGVGASSATTSPARRIFVVAMAVAVAAARPRARPGRSIVVVSMVLFAAGVVTTLWAYCHARSNVSRTEEVGVANLYLLAGPTPPPTGARGRCAAASARRSSSAVAGAIDRRRRPGRGPAQRAGLRDPRADVRHRGEWPVGGPPRSVRPAQRGTRQRPDDDRKIELEISHG